MKDGENNEDFKFVFPANILYVTQSYFSSNLFLSFLWKNFKEKISSAGERTRKKQKQMIAHCIEQSMEKESKFNNKEFTWCNILTQR